MKTRPPPGYSLADEGRVLVLDAERDRVRALELDRLESALGAGTLLRESRGWKSIARVASSQGDVFVKKYDFDKRDVYIRSFFKANFPVFSGPAELENALALRAAGLPAPLPLAAGIVDQGWRRRSFVALEALPGTPLERLEPPRALAKRRSIVGAVAALVKKLHVAGFWHRDLYLANLILDEGTGALGLVDLERVKRRSGGPPWRAVRKDLAALDYSAVRWSETDRLFFLKKYFNVESLDVEALKMARAVRRKARSLARKGLKG